MICCPSSFGRRSGGRQDGRGFEGKERRVGGGGRRKEGEELTTPSTSVFGREGFGNGGEEEEARGGGEEDYGEEFPVFSGTFFPASDEFP